MERHPELVEVDAILQLIRRDLMTLSRSPRKRREYIELAGECIEKALAVG